MEIVFDDVPLLPGVLECAAQGILPGAIERNRESVSLRLGPGDSVSPSGGDYPAAAAGVPAYVNDGVPPALFDILFDAQTSGGLLIAVPEICRRRPGGAALRGRRQRGGGDRPLRRPGPGRVRFAERRDGKSRLSNEDGHSGPSNPKETPTMKCCDENPDAGNQQTAEAAARETGTAVGAVQGTQDKFLDFMKAAGGGGARCRGPSGPWPSPCRSWRGASRGEIHIRKAKEAGLSQDEIDEAAWMAVSFGGCSTMMFYNEVKNRAGRPGGLVHEISRSGGALATLRGRYGVARSLAT